MRPRAVRAHSLLLASKDRTLQRQLRAYLLTLGVSLNGLVIVRSEAEWQKALHRERPRLVVLDDGVSAGNGHGLLSALRQRLPEVLTVYLAEHHTAELERAVRQLGVLYYTGKPPDWDTLGRVFASVLPLSSPSLPPPRQVAATKL